VVHLLVHARSSLLWHRAKMAQAVVHRGPHRRATHTRQLPISCRRVCSSTVLVAAPRSNFYASRFNYVWKSSRRFNVVHYPCQPITYVKFKTKLLHNHFYLLINARDVAALTFAHLQGARQFLHVQLMVQLMWLKLLLWRLNIPVLTITIVI
jgi:hypothetical protein